MKVSGDHLLIFWLRSIMSLFRGGPSASSDAARLDARTKTTFAKSLVALDRRERGWISFADYALLFSSEDIPFSPGMNDTGAIVAGTEFAFAYQCSMDVEDAEMIVYFTRVSH